MSGFRLHRLLFTGPDVETAELELKEGLNIVYGASNTGKSFLLKAILFVMGASEKIPDIKEVENYEFAWLWLTLPEHGEVTLRRSLESGKFSIHEGRIREVGPKDKGRPLSQQHRAGRTNTASYLFLKAIGVADKNIATNESNDKESLTINRVSPYIVVSEENIIAERSPVFASGSGPRRHFERNLFKFILTGIDDSAAITVQTPKHKEVAMLAKIELIDELLYNIDAELGGKEVDEGEVRDQLLKMEQASSGLAAELTEIQVALDALARDRRSEIEERQKLLDKLGEVELTVGRYSSLRDIYDSDLQRLQTIEEGGLVLMAMAGSDCPICGALSKDQVHNHDSKEIELAYKAAEAEAKKIEREQVELLHTIDILKKEILSLNKLAKLSQERVRLFDFKINELRPKESSLREGYELYVSRRAEAENIIELYRYRSSLVEKRAEIDVKPERKKRNTELAPNAETLENFNRTLKKVLTEWGFPDADKVELDAVSLNMTMEGKSRSANGKGVRAVLHAAFSVSVILYCIENNLPYPGFLILDTPLLTYRAPISRHGGLTEDEEELQKTNLAENFYRHLASLKDKVQVVVIENSDPPGMVHSIAHIETFTGSKGNGRFGLF